MVTKNILLSVFFQRYCDAVLLRYVLIRPRVYHFLWFLSLISSRSYVCGAICDSTVTDPRCIFSTVVTVHSSFPLIMTHFVTFIWCILYRWNSNSHVLLGWHRRRPFWYWPWPTNRHRPTSHPLGIFHSFKCQSFNSCDQVKDGCVGQDKYVDSESLWSSFPLKVRLRKSQAKNVLLVTPLFFSLAVCRFQSINQESIRIPWRLLISSLAVECSSPLKYSRI